METNHTLATGKIVSCGAESTGRSALVALPKASGSNEHSSGPLSISDAQRIQSAHHWLDLGEPDSALRELEALPNRAWNHPAAVKECVTALQALGRF